MSLFNTVSMTLRRYTDAGTYVKGRFVAGSYTDSTITGTWQPASGADMKALPEGRRDMEAFTGFTASPVHTTDSVNQEQGDVIIMNGDEYEVIRVERWQNQVLPHYKFWAVRKGEIA